MLNNNTRKQLKNDIMAVRGDEASGLKDFRVLEFRDSGPEVRGLQGL